MPDSMSVLGRVVLEFIKMGVAFDNGGILAVNPTPARSANASSQTKSFINASLPIFHFPLIFQVGSHRAELEFAIVLEPSYRTVPEMEYRLS